MEVVNVPLEETINLTQDINKSLLSLQKLMLKMENIDYQILTDEDRAKLNTTIAYVYATLYYISLKVYDKKTKGHPILESMQRIKKAMTTLHNKINNKE